jgi:hypothetical protein
VNEILTFAGEQKQEYFPSNVAVFVGYSELY